MTNHYSVSDAHGKYSLSLWECIMWVALQKVIVIRDSDREISERFMGFCPS